MASRSSHATPAITSRPVSPCSIPGLIRRPDPRSDDDAGALVKAMSTGVAFAIKAEVRDLRAKTFMFSAQKTMYGGKHIAKGDTVFVFASENEGGQGVIACGVVTSTEAIAKKSGVLRQTPRVSIAVKRTGLAKQPLGRSERQRSRVGYSFPSSGQKPPANPQKISVRPRPSLRRSSSGFPARSRTR